MVGFERAIPMPYEKATFSKWYVDMKISIPFRNIFVSIKISPRDDLMVEKLLHYSREDANETNNGYKKRQKLASTKSVISNPLLLHD